MTSAESRHARVSAHVAALSVRWEDLRRRSRDLAARSHTAIRSPQWTSSPEAKRTAIAAPAREVRSVARLLRDVAAELHSRAALAAEARKSRASAAGEPSADDRAF
jgi:hypothetical protein